MAIKKGLVALILVFGNMVGSGMFMLPASLAPMVLLVLSLDGYSHR